MAIDEEYGIDTESDEIQEDQEEEQGRLNYRTKGEDPKYGIRDIFNTECAHLTIDTNLLKRLKRYQVGFVNKNQESVAFFGGNLTGVHVVRFMPSDRTAWFDEVLEVDEEPLETLLHKLPTVNANWHISSDAMNLSCVWLAYKIYNSKLSATQKHDGLVDVMLILQYKYLTSILFNYFRYPADRAIAEAVYASLSYKFGIKIYGSWSAFLVARVETILHEDGLHAHVIAKMENDTEITYLLNDAQGRIRDLIKNIMGIHIRLKEQGVRISTTSAITTDYEGEEILKDTSKSLMNYNRYLSSIITDKNSFIKIELVNVIEDLIHTMPPKLFNTTLEWMSHNYRQQGASEIEDLCNQVLIHAWNYIDSNKNLIRNNKDLAELLGRLKGVYMASRGEDPLVVKLRELGNKVVRLATGNKNESVISSTRTGTMLYILLRTMVMKHYS